MINRVKRIGLLFEALFYILKYGAPNKEVLNPNKIVVFQLAKLGDMVCTTPMFRAIKNFYPRAHLTVVGDGLNKALLEYHKDVDRYIVWQKGDIKLMVEEVRKEGYDFACMAGPNFEGLSTLILSGVKTIAVPQVLNGWSPYETRPYRILRKFTISRSHIMGSYAPREYLKLLEPIEIYSKDTTKSLLHSELAEGRIKKYLEENDISKKGFFVAVSATAGNKIKEWPKERFAKVADHLISKYQAKVLILGGPRDDEQVSEVLASMKNKALGANEFNIDELKALISKLSLLIAVDTGPIYIAEAYGIPTIDIVGPMDENEQPPISPINKVVVPRGRVKPELHIMNARAYDEKKACEQVLAITAEEVIQAADDLINNLSK